VEHRTGVRVGYRHADVGHYGPACIGHLSGDRAAGILRIGIHTRQNQKKHNNALHKEPPVQSEEIAQSLSAITIELANKASQGFFKNKQRNMKFTKVIM
jgi:hypothetical protein